MPVPDLIHALLGALKELPPNRWICSVDNVRKGPVKEHKVGVRNLTTAWSRWKFVIDGKDHDLEVEREGANTKIVFDTKELKQPHLDIHPDVHGFSIITVVKCHYIKDDGSAGEYRFDGTNFSPFG